MPNGSNQSSPTHLSSVVDAWGAATEAALVASVRIRTSEYADRCAMQLEILNDLARDLALKALKVINLFPTRGAELPVNHESGWSNVAPSYRRATTRLVEIAIESGIVELTNRDTFARISDWPSEIPSGLFLKRARHSEMHMDIFNFVCGFGEALPSVMTGGTHPAELLFRGGMAEAAMGLYVNAPPFVYCNEIAASAIRGIVGAIESQDKLTVVEIGAGTGATTQIVLPTLDGHLHKYFFTDISTMFLTDAKNRFISNKHIQYELLDIEDGNASKVIGPCDILIAAHVLHATVNIAETLKNIRGMLSDGGIVILLEETEMQTFFSTTMGFQTGFDRFQDTWLRKSHPLLEARAWGDELAKAGFRNSFALPSVMGISPILAQA